MTKKLILLNGMTKIPYFPEDYEEWYLLKKAYKLVRLTLQKEVFFWKALHKSLSSVSK